MRKASNWRANQPVTLGEQVLAWLLSRDGEPTASIASILRRNPTEARRILYGE